MAGRGRRDQVLAVFHLIFGPLHAATCEHCIGYGIGYRISGNAHIAICRTDIGDLNQTDAKLKIQCLRRPGGSGRHGIAHSVNFVGRAGKTCAIAAKQERIIRMAKRVADRANDRGPDHVDILETTGLDRLGRTDNIRRAHPPVIWQGMVHRAIKDLGEVVKRRNVAIKVGHIGLTIALNGGGNRQTRSAINNAVAVRRLRVLYAGNRSCV